ncbi:pseudouridine synthase [Kitasatospora sp. NPDC096147]|uniref:pseudouridine synthase n=1 Tax=Kitasatospora sp. NPDC096147 TaxID=3364093 RepID=UPI0038048C4E
MRRRPAAPPSPLPQRLGVDPVRRRLPAADRGEDGGEDGGGWLTVRDYLRELLPVDAESVDALFEGDGPGDGVHGTDGRLTADSPFVPEAWIWYHRDLPSEVEVPFPLTVVHRDERIVVADKPHFLSIAPRGKHVTQTALALLRHRLGLPELSPAHRLDRLTAGLVLFVVRPQDRRAYQELFAERRVRKEYRAVAPYRPGLELPCTVENRLVKERTELTAREVPGEANSRSVVELLTRDGRWGGYRLLPETGKTHQLRVHLAGLGIPIANDPLYPCVLPEQAPDDFRDPLQLLAHTLEFTDPLTGSELRFESTRQLAHWPGRPASDPAL